MLSLDLNRTPTSRSHETQPTIAGVVLCLNEAANLPRCLASLAWCDELLVVDSGSQLRPATVRVVCFESVGRRGRSPALARTRATRDSVVTEKLMQMRRRRTQPGHGIGLKSDRGRQQGSITGQFKWTCQFLLDGDQLVAVGPET